MTTYQVRYWRKAIAKARLGDVALLSFALSLGMPIPEQVERSLRDVLVALLDGKIKRPHRRPKTLNPGWPTDFALFQAVHYVGRYKAVQSARYQRKRGVEKEAIAKAAAKFVVDEDRLHNYLHRSKRRRAEN